MSCKHCGSGRHLSKECPTLNLTRFLLGQPCDEENLPDFVGVMTEEELFDKSEDDLHDEVIQINKLIKGAKNESR